MSFQNNSVKTIDLKDRILKEVNKLFNQQEFVPANRMEFPYRSTWLNGSVQELFYRVPYQKASVNYTPYFLIDQLKEKTTKLKDGDVKTEIVIETKETDFPYLFHKCRYSHVEVENELINTSTQSEKIMDCYFGLTDDKRWIEFTASPTEVISYFQSKGFTMGDNNRFKQWKDFIKVQIAENAKKEKIYLTHERGWMSFEKSETPFYIYGNHVIRPHNATKQLKAVQASGKETAKNLGYVLNGSMEGWKDLMNQVLLNPDIATILGFVASSACLTRIPEMEPGLLHLVGASSSGKTSAMQVAASLIGFPGKPNEKDTVIQSWCTTDNGVENPLSQRMCAPSFYDELGEKSRNNDVLSFLYRITNGKGKDRMSGEGDNLPTKKWATQLLSTGEISFSGLVAENQKQFTDGLRFRVMELELDNTFWPHLEEQSRHKDFGSYQDIVKRYVSSNSTGSCELMDSQSRRSVMIEAIVRGVKANCGNFWPQWIRFLQSENGMTTVKTWFSEERDRLMRLVDSKSSAIFIRRTKHIAAALMGVRGILHVCQWSDDQTELILNAARVWAEKTLWGTGIDTEKRDQNIMVEKFEQWILNNQYHFLSETATQINAERLGWIDKLGNCFVSVDSLEKIATRLGLDPQRLKKSISGDGWEAIRKRIPTASNQTKQVRGYVKRIFNSLDVHGNVTVQRDLKNQQSVDPAKIFGEQD